MYIDYEKIFEILALFTPIRMRRYIRRIGYNLKIFRNLSYIQKNQKKVLKDLKLKVSNGEKLNVAFYIYDETKWKCQSIYDLLEQSDLFVPYIYVTKSRAGKALHNYQRKEDIIKVYDFFKNKGMRVKYAYDFEKDDYIAFEDMEPKPDMIFYSHPWYVYETQGPVMTSKYALTYYVPYSVSASLGQQEYYLRFYLYLYCQYVQNEELKNHFGKNMQNHGKNLKAVGHPILDFFYLNKDRKFENKKYVIYAPHWSVGLATSVNWGTFQWSGKFILDYARKHPEFNWVFKPHPVLRKFLLDRMHMTEEELEQYWKAWEKVGQVMDTGDYLEMFMESEAMITDCGSFKTEYFMTQRPQIFLKAGEGMAFNPAVNRINETSYQAQNEQELEAVLDEVLIKGNDYKKAERERVYQEYGYKDCYAAQNILDDLKNTVGAK